MIINETRIIFEPGTAISLLALLSLSGIAMAYFTQKQMDEVDPERARIMLDHNESLTLKDRGIEAIRRAYEIVAKSQGAINEPIIMSQVNQYKNTLESEIDLQHQMISLDPILAEAHKQNEEN